jgi:hypothetical protein
MRSAVPSKGGGSWMKTFIKECRWGSFLLLRGDMISTFADIYGEWSEMEIRLFQKLLTPESNVVEVGSNLGLHTVALSKIANKGKIICFERSASFFKCSAPTSLSIIFSTSFHAVPESAVKTALSASSLAVTI